MAGGIRLAMTTPAIDAIRRRSAPTLFRRTPEMTLPT
jgi:hypothetical protein